MNRPTRMGRKPLAAVLLAAGAVTSGAMASPVVTLPIEFGFYVREDVACRNWEWLPVEPDPPLKLVGRRYISLNAGTRCDFGSMERKADQVFEIDMACEYSLGGQSESYDDRATFRILARNRVEIGVSNTNIATAIYRYCPQSELPEPFSSNDISDAIAE